MKKIALNLFAVLSMAALLGGVVLTSTACPGEGEGEGEGE